MNRLFTTTNAQGGQYEQLQNATKVQQEQRVPEKQTEVFRTQILEATMHKTQLTLAETKREILTPDNLKMILVVIVIILETLI